MSDIKLSFPLQYTSTTVKCDLKLKYFLLETGLLGQMQVYNFGFYGPMSSILKLSDKV
jgi:hypothetical protein